MAPSARAVHKAEAKYGVTADYPDLQLHAAAANGNVGLVKYALMHGQPVNSVLNGVLPIHIAASSGNDMVVQMLIDAGADVNAARLPRKYNADRSKAISSIGAAGSTPLHFAAANGHAHIVSLLLSHGANPDATEKHGLTPEDLAREAGHLNVVTVFRLWRQDQEATDHSSEAGHSHYLGNEFYSSPPSASGSGYSGGGGKLASSATSIHSVASTTGRKLLSKPSLDSISNKGKKLAKAASNPNLAGLLPMSSSSRQASSNAGPSNTHSAPYALASSFAQPQVALRQNPSKALANYMQNHPNAPLIHHVINLDKSRRPSLPSVFEKAAHPSQSIKSALGLSSHANSGRLGSRGGSTSSQDHDPYHLARPQRSASKTSLSGLFKGHHHNKEKSTESYASQPLSPAASTFFTGDDELEQAERDIFLRTEGSSDNDNGLYQQPFSGIIPARTDTGNPDGRRTSIEGFMSLRSRAGSTSSAATSQSNVSYAPRVQDTRSLFNYPMTAPPTQTTFTNLETDPSQPGHVSRPGLSAHSSAGSVIIPQPIPPPPSSSTQPFFSKAAIAAAHNNNTAARPGFYRPRKSSQLSTAASTVSNINYTVSSPDPDSRSLSHQARSAGGSSDAEASLEGQTEGTTLVPPALIVRRPTVRDGTTSQEPEDGMRNLVLGPSSPRAGPGEPVIAVSPPSSIHGRSTQMYSSNGNRHSRTTSEGAGSIRPSSNLPDVQESPESQLRPPHYDQPSPSRASPQSANEVDRNGRRESEDVFPPHAEAPFTTRSRAGSRARVDSAGSSTGALPHLNLSGTGNHQSPSLAGHSGFQQQHPAAESDAHWKAVTRAHRSDSTTTDTRTSRSGSVGESGGQHHRFFGFDYSSSPTGSTASFKYHPSASTTATSLVSSPPGTAISGGNHGTTVTHAQAQHMVKKKEEELLSYNPSEASEGSSIRRPSLSQQLAAYGDSLAIERELHDAERYRQNPHERIALTIPEPPASAKYSWEILGKESRTSMPVSKGQRAREKHEPPSSVVQQQKLWTHRMVSPYEVPLNRPGTHVGGHRHTPSTGTITSSGKPLTRVVSNETAAPSNERLPSIPQSPALPAIQHPSEHGLRNKPSSTLSLSRNYLAPPQQSGGSDLSIKKSPRLRSVSPSYTSPRSSTERDREKPSTIYHVVAGPGSEPNDSANSSLVSEPRSGLRPHGHGGSSTITIGSRHRHNRSESHSASPSPDASHAAEDQTPRPPQLLRLETVMAPKFHIEQKAGGEAAPSPTKAKFGSKLGKLFR